MSQAVALDIIAVATALIACVHVAVLVAVLLLMTRVTEAVARIEQTTRPVLAHLEEAAVEATHSLSLVRSQLSRWERVVSEKLEVVDRTVGKLQHGIGVPVRESAALVSGVLAIIRAFRHPPKPVAPRANGRGSSYYEEARYEP